MRRTPSAYAYDGLHRRIVRTIDNSADLDHTYHDYYDGQSVVETRNGSDQVLKQHVWGVTYVDELVQVAINGEPIDDPEFDPEDADHDGRYYYAVQNANYNVQLLIDDTAVVVERYEYDPYGERAVYISPGSRDRRPTQSTTIKTGRGSGMKYDPFFALRWGDSTRDMTCPFLPRERKSHDCLEAFCRSVVGLDSCRSRGHCYTT